MFSLSRFATSLVRNIPSCCNAIASFHILSTPNTSALVQNKHLLSPVSHSLVPSCGFKVKGFLRRRCRSCYFVRREDRLYVICDKHPRHKQMSMVKDPKNTWILTHATQGKVRPW